jgi:exodeoxyribonuclease X
MIAHNAYYDDRIFKEHELITPKSICTMRLSRKLLADDENIEEHTLSYLRYALDLPIPDDIPAHLADADVMVTALLFVHLVGIAQAQGIVDDNSDIGEQLIEYLEAPVITTIMPFGKHKGTKLTEVPLSYWHWATANVDSLNEENPAYDKDFAASVDSAIEEILEANAESK